MSVISRVSGPLTPTAFRADRREEYRDTTEERSVLLLDWKGFGIFFMITKGKRKKLLEIQIFASL
jgi:hypothetical protein